MRRFLIIVCALCAICAQAGNTYKADDSRIVYVGRTLQNADGVSFDYSATYARLAFTGNKVAVRMSSAKPILFSVWIDRPYSADPDKVFRVDSRDTLITLYEAKKADKRTHTLMIQRRVEGEHGITTFHSFELNGELQQASALAARQIEFVGDSYTCGYGSENSVKSDPFTIETENPAKTYAAIIARYFGADYWTISHSGMGICRNYATKVPGWYMPDRYTQTFDTSRDSAWVAADHAFKPQLTVIYLGTNDFSTRLLPHREDFVSHYSRLLKSIKANYGDAHPILCVASKCSEQMFEYVRAAAHDCGMSNVYATGVFEGVHLNTDENMGASWHPNYLGHQKIAYTLIPYVSTLTGWTITDAPVK